LNLDYTAVDNKSIVALGALSELRELSLDSANIGDEAVETLGSLKNLRVLNLYHTLISEAGVARIETALPKCRIIWDRDSGLPNRRRT
jgi:hypothetical protein